MPTYEYKCECGNEFEGISKITDRHKCKCPECGAKPIIKPSMFSFDSDVVRTDGKEGMYNVGLGEYHTSKTEMLKSAKRKGLAWIGDDKIKPKPRKKEEPNWNGVYKDLERAGVKN